MPPCLYHLILWFFHILGGYMSIPFHLPAFNRSTKCCLRRRDMEMLPPEGWAIAFFAYDETQH